MTNVLREKRFELYPGLSIREFAEKIGIGRSCYQNWESGTNATPKHVNYDSVIKLAKAFNMTENAILDAISNNHKARNDGHMEKLSTRPGVVGSLAVTNCLTEWRRKNNVTQREMGELLGMSQFGYRFWEIGKVKPTGKDLQNLMELTSLSMHQIASVYTGKMPDPVYTLGRTSTEESKPDVSHVEIEGPYGNVYEDVLKPDPDEPEVIASPITPEEFATLNNEEVHDKMDEVITERDENGKPVAGRYIFQDSDGHAKLTQEGERTVAEHVAKIRRQLTATSIAEDLIKQEALNEPHDFRDEVIDEVLEKMYGQMDYKKYVYLIGLLGR